MPTETIDIRDGLLTRRQVARMLSVSEGTVNRMLKRGELASLKIGNCRRIPRAAVRDLLAASVDTRR